MKKIEAVIFDWAGTTVDYGSFAPVQAFVEAFQEFGIIPTVTEVREPMGMLKWNHIHTMMQIVMPAAKAQGYAPDACFTPNTVNNLGRPLPYMIFRNLEALRVTGVDSAIKVGDTAADIREGKNAGMISVGVIEGSSVMGLTQEEYEALTEPQKQIQIRRVQKFYEGCGADYVIRDLSQLPALIDRIQQAG